MLGKSEQRKGGSEKATMLKQMLRLQDITSLQASCRVLDLSLFGLESELLSTARHMQYMLLQTMSSKW